MNTFSLSSNEFEFFRALTIYSRNTTHRIVDPFLSKNQAYNYLSSNLRMWQSKAECDIVIHDTMSLQLYSSLILFNDRL